MLIEVGNIRIARFCRGVKIVLKSISLAIALIASAATAVVLSDTAIATDTVNRSAPDPKREYYQRTNCHLGYDIVIERRNRKWSVSPEMDSWALAHEAAARDKKPCPQMPADLTYYSVNWLMMTPQGRASAEKFANEQNDPVALSELALSFISGQYPDVEPLAGVPLLQRAAALGDPTATYTLGTLYSSGVIDGTKNHKEGFKLIEKAAGTGHVDAIYRMGFYYQAGLGTRQNDQKAFAAFQRAAEAGHIYAAVVAYDMINEGKGTRKDFDLAYRLGRNLAGKGEVYGAIMAAGALLQGKNPASHENEILYWMDVAIAQGDENIRTQVTGFRQQAVSIFSRSSAPAGYSPAPRKVCEMKTVCTVNHYSGLQSCTTAKDYWSDCDG